MKVSGTTQLTWYGFGIQKRLKSRAVRQRYVHEADGSEDSQPSGAGGPHLRTAPWAYDGVLFTHHVWLYHHCLESARTEGASTCTFHF